MAAQVNAAVTTNTPPTRTLNRVIVVVLSSLDPARGDPEPVEELEPSVVCSMDRILEQRRGCRHVFLTDGPAGMPNWTDAQTSALVIAAGRFVKRLARFVATHGRMNARTNHADESPRRGRRASGA
jgi:hypothetical protein